MSKNKNVVLIVTEGETDELFYKKILEVLRSKTPYNYFLVDKIDYICVKGFGKFDSKLKNKFKRLAKKYKRINKNTQIHVFLCYDNDVFIGKKNPPIIWSNIESDLRRNGADYIYHIIADKAIEDFILIDFEGILKYLNIKKANKNDYQGIDGLKKLHKKAGKGYIKGNKCDELLNNLDFKVIESEICLQLRPLCQVIGVECKHNKNK